MENEKNDSYYIEEMVDDLDKIIAYMDGINEDDFIHDEKLIDCVSFRFILLNSSSKKLSEKFWINNPNINPRLISGFRNKIVHEYNHVDYHIVYLTAKNDVPILKNLLLNSIK